MIKWEQENDLGIFSVIYKNFTVSMKIGKFEDLVVWQAAINLAEEVYVKIENCKDFSFKDQIQGAVVSIQSNIAEEFERRTNKEFIQFLYIAKGSYSEVWTQLYLAQRLQKINQTEAEKMLEDSRIISSMLYKLIKTQKEKFS